MQKSDSDTLESFLGSIYVLSKSCNSVHNYRIYVKHFREFLKEKYQCADSEFVNTIKENLLDIYKVLNEFVVYLDKSGKKPSSIKGIMAATKSYLRYLGLKIYAEDCKLTVRVPKIRRYREEPLTKEILVRLLRTLPLKLQVAVLFATSSGVRTGELVQLKMSDIDFRVKPTLVRIRAEITKTKESRETYLTQEASNALKDYATRYFSWIENGIDDTIKNKVIFGRTNSIGPGETDLYNHRRKEAPKSDPVFIAENVLTSSLNWYVKKIPELNKLNENGRRAIHFYAFRKYFRTIVGNIVGRDYAEALMGHHFYLDTYYNLPTEKRRELYLKAEPHLTISDYTKIESELGFIKEKLTEQEEWRARISQLLRLHGLKFSEL